MEATKISIENSEFFGFGRLLPKVRRRILSDCCTIDETVKERGNICLD